MSHLAKLEGQSIALIREAHKRFGPNGLAALWSMGKDSTTLLWLVRKAFLGRWPFPIIHIDTTYKFPEMYSFRDKIASAWEMPLKIVKNEAALSSGMNKARGRLKCCHALKTTALEQTVTSDGIRALFLAIRRDEHGVRAKERYVSPRGKDFSWNYKDQPLEMANQFADLPEDKDIHLRVHPLLDWTELDIWEYIAQESIPVISLYFATKQASASVRYRSIGCSPCTAPVPSTAATIAEIVDELKTTTIRERDGRAQDKENADAMQKLRALGYM